MAPWMPTNAIESTEVDFVLPAQEIGPKLVELANSETAMQVQPISNGVEIMAAGGQT
jgi:hypothetical protein